MAPPFSCCDKSMVNVHIGEKVSVASANSKNSNRCINTINERDRFLIGSKVDGLFDGASHEVGCLEAGRSHHNYSTKELNDRRLKMPKTMKDMLYQLAKEKSERAKGFGDCGFHDFDGRWGTNSSKCWY
ncbi:hypothetical protein BCR42DRAFT_160152 [Absidia repens]|uniref:Uncharacterized protein n=1 Tax=Absidia repens TaxID=90262 RepID=A0A1X2I066_9FUNG|nr:hypothetical protein BCR42DRAFT_160152 [Absidia repens]